MEPGMTVPMLAVPRTQELETTGSLAISGLNRNIVLKWLWTSLGLALCSRRRSESSANMFLKAWGLPLLVIASAIPLAAAPPA